ncbi:hypothetical protein CFD26_103817 [Aspergillus turcosus]|uniref:FAD linked oxidase N-terminal domain-containing protein n=1 Tax=Aspergillus turcosus TaxID=1245748 RepID=A0A3R7F7T8_9EURO|nr:hypothetical protein CFD26_103817 [Aspergillus turcosus]
MRGQGRLPLYAIHVQSIKDIQRAVEFASKHNLRLSIRNTGHDRAGRSTAPYSLQIVTSGLKQLRASPTDEGVWDTLKQVLEVLPEHNEQGNASIMAEFYLPGSPARTSINRLMQKLEGLSLIVDHFIDSFEKASTWYSVPKRLNQAGVAMLTGCVLVSQDILSKTQGISAIAKALSQVTLGALHMVSIDALGGGK